MVRHTHTHTLATGDERGQDHHRRWQIRTRGTCVDAVYDIYSWAHLHFVRVFYIDRSCMLRPSPSQTLIGTSILTHYGRSMCGCFPGKIWETVTSTADCLSFCCYERSSHWTVLVVGCLSVLRLVVRGTDCVSPHPPRRKGAASPFPEMAG